MFVAGTLGRQDYPRITESYVSGLHIQASPDDALICTQATIRRFNAQNLDSRICRCGVVEKPENMEEDRYWQLLESTQRQWYPGFVEELSRQAAGKRQEGRVAVIMFQDGAKPSVLPFETFMELRDYLAESPSGTYPNTTIRRRTFVLEGLPRDFIQVLGSKLKIPPSLFAAHWASPTSFIGSLLNRTMRNYDNRNRFTLMSPKIHWVEIEGEETPDPVYFMESSVNRQLSRITVFGDMKGPLLSFERLSFWSACEGQSWDAVLLLDPPLGDHVMRMDNPIPLSVVHRSDISANFLDTDKYGVCQDGSWYPPFMTDWEHSEQVPGMRSMFDDILHLYPIRQRRSTVDPATSTDICRQLVLSAWIARLRIAEDQVIQKQYQMSIGPGLTKFKAKTWLDRSWTRPWREREFGGLVRAKSALEWIDSTLFYNMDALGIGGTSQTTEEWEAEAWKSLQNTLLTLKTRVGIMSEAYSQAVSIHESIVANKQARQVGYLTSLATLFLPVSFIAAVFSMGGDFAAGQASFWMFWAISIPIVFVASSMYLFGGRVLGWLRKCSGSRKREEHLV